MCKIHKFINLHSGCVRVLCISHSHGAVLVSVQDDDLRFPALGQKRILISIYQINFLLQISKIKSLSCV